MAKERFIRSKIVMFFGINDRYAGMFTVDSQEEVEAIDGLLYGFPYYYKLYDEIPRLSDSCDFIVEEAEITTKYKDVDGVFRSVRKKISNMKNTKEQTLKKIEELFGSS